MRALIAALAILTTAGTVKAQDPIEVVDQRTELLTEDIMNGRAMDEVVLYLTIANRTDAHVSAWRAVAVFADPFGDEMFKIRLTSGQANIPPGETKDARFAFEDNPYINDEAADQLAQYDAEKLTITLEDIRVVN